MTISRRSGVLLLYFTWCGPGAFAGAQPRESLAMFRGDAARRGVSTSAGPARYGGIAWRFQTGGAVRSSPVVVGETVYIGSGDGNLYALDRLTGEERWHSFAGAGVSGSPAITDGAVFFSSMDGAVHAVARNSGRRIWRSSTGTAQRLPWGYEGTDYYASSPAVAAGRVIVGGADGGVWALDAGTGQRAWRFATGARVRSSPSVVGTTVYVGSFDGSVYALSLRDGSLAWKHQTHGTGLESRQFGFDRRSINATAAVDNGVVYVGSRDGHLYALDANTGARRWEYAHPENSWAIASVAVRDTLVVGGSSDAQFIHAVHARTGKELWRTKSSRAIWSSPTIARDMVFVGAGGYANEPFGIVYALDLHTGAVRWRFIAPSAVLSSPTVDREMVLVGGDDGAVYALRGDDDEMRRAVFWDSTALAHANVRDHARVRDFLRIRGYTVLDSTALQPWLAEGIASRARSVLVFAIDHAPRSVGGVASDTVLLRRFLDAGGKVVSLGMPPRVWPPDAAGERQLTSLDGSVASAMLGVRIDPPPWDRYAATPTTLGRRWGLLDGWLSGWAIPPQDAIAILARDERGFAAAWVRSYGGVAGSGLVQLGRGEWDERSLGELTAIAEYFPIAAGPQTSGESRR